MDLRGLLTTAVVYWTLGLGGGQQGLGAAGAGGRGNSEVDFLQAIGIPLSNDVSFVTGIDGYPAFRLGAGADIRKSARNIITKLYKDFSLAVTVKPEDEQGGFLLAIVNPLETIVQFGIALTPSGVGWTNISIFYTDYRDSEQSNVIAKFKVENITKRWTRFAVKVEGEIATLYYDCQPHQPVRISRKVEELPFDPASSLFLGQGGDYFARKFKGALQELKVTSNPLDAEDSRITEF